MKCAVSAVTLADGTITAVSDHAPNGINIENVTRWFEGHTEITAPLEFGLIAGGRSNMTFTVTDAAGRQFVLRRPPMGPAAAECTRCCPRTSPHGRVAEQRRASSSTRRVVPRRSRERTRLLCDAFPRWHRRARCRDCETIPVETRTRMSHELIDTLVALHRSTSMRSGSAILRSAADTSNDRSSVGMASGSSRKPVSCR